MSVRLFHRGARLVFVVRRVAPGGERWWSPHLARPAWHTVFGAALVLLGLPFDSPTEHSLSCRLGQIDWTTERGWSIMTLRLNGGSETKRRLVVAALLKAARYSRPERHIAEED
jgi:hypothetical protein